MEEKYHNLINPIFNELSAEIIELGEGVGLNVETSIASPFKIKIKYKTTDDELLIGFKQLVLDFCEKYRVLAAFEEV